MVHTFQKCDRVCFVREPYKGRLGTVVKVLKKRCWMGTIYVQMPGLPINGVQKVGTVICHPSDLKKIEVTK